MNGVETISLPGVRAVPQTTCYVKARSKTEPDRESRKGRAAVIGLVSVAAKIYVATQYMANDLPKLDKWLYIRVSEELLKKVQKLARKDRRKAADFVRVTLENLPE